MGGAGWSIQTDCAPPPGGQGMMEAPDKDTSGLSPKDRAALTLGAWKRTVDVQQHFNDIELRIRNLVLTLLGAAVAAMGVAGTAPYRIPILLATLVLAAAFWIMDRHWYHRLLTGAVQEGARLEGLLQKQGVQVGLGGAISAASAIAVLGRQVHSRSKIDLFYLLLASVVLLTLGSLLSGVWRVLAFLSVPAIWFVWLRSLASTRSSSGR
jgi:hypothetical protein